MCPDINPSDGADDADGADGANDDGVDAETMDLVRCFRDDDCDAVRR